MSKKPSKGGRRPAWVSKELLAKQMEEKGVWNMERVTGHLGGIQDCCQSMQGSNEEG